MKNLFSLIIFIIIIMAINIKPSFAAENSAGSSAALLKPSIDNENDNRVVILKAYLEKYSSPLTSNADDFIKYADSFNLDWKLVCAISGVESTFGKQIPYNSYNGWGWGIYGDNMIRFSSWEEGIQTVSEGLRTNYLNKWGAENVYEIGRYYAASPTWASRVEYFMNDINKFALGSLKSLPISL